MSRPSWARYGVTLHLLGSSPLAEVDYRHWTKDQINAHRADVMHRRRRPAQKPNVAWDRVSRRIEIQQNLARLCKAGVRATYHACNLADRTASPGSSTRSARLTDQSWA